MAMEDLLFGFNPSLYGIQEEQPRDRSRLMSGLGGLGMGMLAASGPGANIGAALAGGLQRGQQDYEARKQRDFQNRLAMAQNQRAESANLRAQAGEDRMAAMHPEQLKAAQTANEASAWKFGEDKRVAKSIEASAKSVSGMMDSMESDYDMPNEIRLTIRSMEEAGDWEGMNKVFGEWLKSANMSNQAKALAGVELDAYVQKISVMQELGMPTPADEAARDDRRLDIYDRQVSTQEEMAQADLGGNRFRDLIAADKARRDQMSQQTKLIQAADKSILEKIDAGVYPSPSSPEEWEALQQKEIAILTGSAEVAQTEDDKARILAETEARVNEAASKITATQLDQFIRANGSMNINGRQLADLPIDEIKRIMAAMAEYPEEFKQTFSGAM
jgi:hypothetical protein